MNKYLFNLPRPSIPIFDRKSGVAAAASVGTDNQSAATQKSNDDTSFARSDIEFPIRRGKLYDISFLFNMLQVIYFYLLRIIQYTV